MCRTRRRVGQGRHVRAGWAGRQSRAGRSAAPAASSLSGQGLVGESGGGFDQSHPAFRALAWRVAHDLHVHGAYVLTGLSFRADGMANFSRHVPIESGGGAYEDCQQKDADEVEIAFDEFHMWFTFVSMVSFLRFEHPVWPRSFAALPDRPGRSTGRVRTTSGIARSQRGHT